VGDRQSIQGVGNLTQVACPPQQWEGLAATLAAFEASL
jgi:hypothetical protein